MPDDRRAAVVARLCEEGHANRLLLSHDANCWNDRQSPKEMANQRPKWHHRHVVENIAPMLGGLGVTQEQIGTMLRANPRSIFGNVGATAKRADETGRRSHERGRDRKRAHTRKLPTGIDWEQLSGVPNEGT